MFLSSFFFILFTPFLCVHNPRDLNENASHDFLKKENGALRNHRVSMKGGKKSRLDK